ncbi:MAG TPA: ABC transporter substrate-binding protein [Chloroflexota bacterium]|nr:ABC transporter substrate-binding protein [Chloroflexota bacterium]
MGKLALTLACGGYDRTQALMDGTVAIEGVDLNYLRIEPPGEIFWRQVRHDEFDVSELTMSAYIIGLSRGDDRFVAIPVFPLRLFRHAFIWVRDDAGIITPTDLREKRIAIPEYHMTAMLYIRGMLQHDYGVLPEEIDWYRTRVERVELNLSPKIRISDAQSANWEEMLARGQLDGTMGTRAPRAAGSDSPGVRRLFSEVRDVEADYYRRTGIFPIMHVVAMKREIYERNRWVAKALLDAFEASKAHAYARMRDVSGIYSLPWLSVEQDRTRAIFGADPYPYGLEPNRTTLEAATQYSYEQGLSARKVSVEEMFARETVDVFVEH